MTSGPQDGVVGNGGSEVEDRVPTTDRSSYAKFPPRLKKTVFKSLDPTFLDERRRKMDEYLTQLMSTVRNHSDLTVQTAVAGLLVSLATANVTPTAASKINWITTRSAASTGST